MAKPLGEFEQLILFALVELGDTAYGVSIRREIESRTAKHVSSGAVYTALDRLESRGLVTSAMGEPSSRRGGRRKKYYRIEPSGASLLDASYQRLMRMAKGLAPKLAEITGQNLPAD